MQLLPIPGLCCELHNEKTGKACYHQFADEIDSLALQLTELTRIVQKMESHGKVRDNRPEYLAHLQLAFGFGLSGGQVTCLHNCRELKYGGVHLNHAKDQICKSISSEFCIYIGTIHSFREIAAHVILIVETKCPPCSSQWTNETKISIENRMIADMTDEILQERFRSYLHEHHNEILAVMSHIRRKCEQV